LSHSDLPGADSVIPFEAASESTAADTETGITNSSPARRTEPGADNVVKEIISASSRETDKNYFRNLIAEETRAFTLEEKLVTFYAIKRASTFTVEQLNDLFAQHASTVAEEDLLSIGYGSPFKAIAHVAKKAAHSVAKVAKTVGKGVVKAAKAVGKVAMAGAKWVGSTIKTGLGVLAGFILGPVVAECRRAAKKGAAKKLAILKKKGAAACMAICASAAMAATDITKPGRWKQVPGKSITCTTAEFKGDLGVSPDANGCLKFLAPIDVNYAVYRGKHCFACMIHGGIKKGRWKAAKGDVSLIPVLQKAKPAAKLPAKPAALAAAAGAAATTAANAAAPPPGVGVQSPDRRNITDVIAAAPLEVLEDVGAKPAAKASAKPPATPAALTAAAAAITPPLGYVCGSSSKTAAGSGWANPSCEPKKAGANVDTYAATCNANPKCKAFNIDTKSKNTPCWFASATGTPTGTLTAGRWHQCKKSAEKAAPKKLVGKKVTQALGAGCTIACQAAIKSITKQIGAKGLCPSGLARFICAKLGLGSYVNNCPGLPKQSKKPKCQKGWWKNKKDVCLQRCPSNKQGRNAKGRCICGKGGDNQNCGKDEPKCVTNECIKHPKNKRL